VALQSMGLRIGPGSRCNVTPMGAAGAYALKRLR
jgi:hypothetical protein